MIDDDKVIEAEFSRMKSKLISEGFDELAAAQLIADSMSIRADMIFLIAAASMMHGADKGIAFSRFFLSEVTAHLSEIISNGERIRSASRETSH